MRELEMATLKDVGSEILQSRLAGGDRLGVDIPVDKPGLGWDLREPPGFYHFIAELGSEDYRESFEGEEEIDLGGMPGAIGRRQSATANDVVVDVFALEEILLGFGFRNQIGGLS
jgi:hypothetical protein